MVRVIELGLGLGLLILSRHSPLRGRHSRPTLCVASCVLVLLFMFSLASFCCILVGAFETHPRDFREASKACLGGNIKPFKTYKIWLQSPS